MSKSINIFLKENEDFNSVKKKLSDKLDVDKLYEKLDRIFAKIYNNQVGYYLFKDKDRYYKIFVLPKTIEITNDEKEVIKQFIDYLKVHFRLKAKYKEYDVVGENLSSNIEFSFDSFQKDQSAQDIEQFIFYRFYTILMDIKRFFSTHKSTKRELVHYASQTIKYKMDLKRNITEINKAKIHQLKQKDIIYSIVANIAYGALRLFNKTKLELIDSNNREKLLKLSNEILNLLKRDFKVDCGYRVSLTGLISSKTYKHFKQKQSFKMLYYNLLMLFGLENFFDEKSNKEINNDILSQMFFIKPELMYEWVVYDYLKRHCKFLDIEKEPIKEYKLVQYSNRKDKDIVINSKPDIVAIDRRNSKMYIIDVKWKILEDRPNLDDLLKLKRDYEVRKNDAKKIFSILVYPKFGKSMRKSFFEEYLNIDRSSFCFYVRSKDVS